MHNAHREKVTFPSGDSSCAAWLYPGASQACVIMAPGAGVIKEPGTDRFATRFNAAGFTVLAFDYRGFGESGGTARQVIKPAAQLADWAAAISFAKALDAVDADRIAVWGFSLSGGHALRVAAQHQLAAAVAQTPLTDGLAATRNAVRHETVPVVLGFPFIALWDSLRGLFGKSAHVIPLAGPRGAVAMLTTPDALDADRALNPGNAYPEWEQTVAARSVLGLARYRVGRAAAGLRCPTLMIVADDDQSALAEPAVRVARQSPRVEVVHLTGSHYAPFLGEHETAVAATLEFLQRRLLAADDARPPSAV